MRLFPRAVTALVIALVLASIAAPAASAQTDADTEPTVSPVEISDPILDDDSPVGEIIPKPNSGTAPQGAGDRGGVLQLTLFGLLLLFAVVAVTRVALSGRDARRRYAATALTPDASRSRTDATRP